MRDFLEDAPVETPADDRIEPGSPSPENALFVLLGVLSAVAAFVHLVGLFG